MMAIHFGVRLTVHGPRRSLQAFKKRAEGTPPTYAGDSTASVAGVQYLCFHSLVPVPEHLRAKPYVCSGTCGRDWELEHWGCAWGIWGIERVDVGNDLLYHFEVRPAPPVAYVLAASRLFPDLSFRLLWTDRAAQEDGTMLIVNGSIVSKSWEE